MRHLQNKKWIFSVFVFLFLFFIHFTAKATSLNEEEGLDAGLATEEVYVGPRLRINIPARQLFLYDQEDNLVKVYDIAVGQNRFKTPIGRRYMNEIVWNPWWIPPKSEWAKNDKPTKPGPRNPLGPVKMKLSSAIMIHGTNKDSTIGRTASHGCIRMHSIEAKELARYLQKQITDQNDNSVFSQYEKNSGRSYYVQLTQKIPVDFDYDVVEVRDGTLYVFQDVYFKVSNISSLIETKLREHGYDPSEMDMDMIKATLKKNKNTDLSFSIKKLAKKGTIAFHINELLAANE